jgi:hypothetical protein
MNKQCFKCKSIIHGLENYGTDKEPLCFDCANILPCSICGKATSMNDQIKSENKIYCKNCYQKPGKLQKRTENTSYAELRTLSLKFFIGFLGVTALIAIISVISKELGELQLKIIATSFTISAASICTMSCAAFIEKKKLIRLGISGILLSIISGILVIFGLWAEMESDSFWHSTYSLIVIALAFAHAFLLSLPNLGEKQAVQGFSFFSIGVLALLIIIAIWGRIEETGYYQFLSVVAIIVALFTLIIPILLKLSKENQAKNVKLVLENVDGDIYKDVTGKKYLLKEIKP